MGLDSCPVGKVVLGTHLRTHPACVPSIRPKTYALSYHSLKAPSLDPRAPTPPATYTVYTLSH